MKKHVLSEINLDEDSNAVGGSKDDVNKDELLEKNVDNVSSSKDDTDRNRNKVVDGGLFDNNSRLAKDGGTGQFNDVVDGFSDVMSSKDVMGVLSKEGYDSNDVLDG